MTEKEPTSTAQHDQSVGENSKRQRVSLTTQIVPGLQQIFFALRMRTIRTRLPVAFVVMVLLPAATIIATSVVGGLQGGRQQVFNQLESVATLKEAEITTGLQELQLDLSFELSRETAPQQISNLLQLPPDSASFQAAYDEQLARFQQAIELRKKFEELSLVNYQGQVILSTDPAQKGKIYATQTYFKRGLEGPYINPPMFSLVLGRMVIMVAHPIKDQQGQVIGVLAGRVSMATLNEIMNERAGLGQTGETYLVGSNRALLTELRSAENLYVRTQGVNTAIENQANGSGDYENYHGMPVIGVYHWLPELQVVLLAEQDQSEALRATYTTRNLNVGVALASVLLAVLVSLLITRSIASPLADLAKTATQVAAGDLERAAEVKGEDEIGAVAQAFNRMTAQLRGLIGSLEQHVAERTAELSKASASLSHRVNQLQAGAEVSRAATTLTDPEQLIPRVVELIHQRFEFYYVGLFLVDADNRYAVLQHGLGTGSAHEAGRVMKERGHRLEVGSQSMVGWACANMQARIALDVGQDAVRFANPLLPDTRSEMALPLRAGERVIGALDVQSAQAAAFDESDIAALQGMADQVAVALENARLFQQTRAALKELEATNRLLVREGWQGVLEQKVSHRAEFLAASGPVQAPLQGKAAPETEPLTVPLELRGQSLGRLSIRRESNPTWSDEEFELIRTLAQQTMLAADNARLIEQTRRALDEARALYETSREITSAGEMSEVLTAVLNNMAHTGIHAAAIALFDAPTREQATYIELAGTWDYAGTPRLAPGARFAIADFPLFVRITIEKALVSQDLLSDPEIDEMAKAVLGGLGFRAMSVTPLVARDQWIGVLFAMMETLHTFTPSELNFHRALADQTAIAIDSRRLLAETQHRAEREQLIRQITTRIRAAGDIQGVLETTATELARSMGVSRSIVRLTTGDSA